jgi:hypothetical protein
MSESAGERCEIVVGAWVFHRPTEKFYQVNCVEMSDDGEKVQFDDDGVWLATTDLEQVESPEAYLKELTEGLRDALETYRREVSSVLDKLDRVARELVEAGAAEPVGRDSMDLIERLATKIIAERRGEATDGQQARPS